MARSRFARLGSILGYCSEYDIHLMVGDRVMALRGEKTVTLKEPVETRRAIDRHYGRSACSFRRPADADPQKVRTALRDGVLDMGVPRRQTRPSATCPFGQMERRAALIHV